MALYNQFAWGQIADNYIDKKADIAQSYDQVVKALDAIIQNNQFNGKTLEGNEKIQIVMARINVEKAYQSHLQSEMKKIDEKYDVVKPLFDNAVSLIQILKNNNVNIVWPKGTIETIPVYQSGFKPAGKGVTDVIASGMDAATEVLEKAKSELAFHLDNTKQFQSALNAKQDTLKKVAQIIKKYKDAENEINLIQEKIAKIEKQQLPESPQNKKNNMNTFLAEKLKQKMKAANPDEEDEDQEESYDESENRDEKANGAALEIVNQNAGSIVPLNLSAMHLAVDAKLTHSNEQAVHPAKQNADHEANVPLPPEIEPLANPSLVSEMEIPPAPGQIPPAPKQIPLAPVPAPLPPQNQPKASKVVQAPVVAQPAMPLSKPEPIVVKNAPPKPNEPNANTAVEEPKAASPVAKSPTAPKSSEDKPLTQQEIAQINALIDMVGTARGKGISEKYHQKHDKKFFVKLFRKKPKDEEIDAIQTDIVNSLKVLKGLTNPAKRDAYFKKIEDKLMAFEAKHPAKHSTLKPILTQVREAIHQSALGMKLK